jgi:hypothetical protein
MVDNVLGSHEKQGPAIPDVPGAPVLAGREALEMRWSSTAEARERRSGGTLSGEGRAGVCVAFRRPAGSALGDERISRAGVCQVPGVVRTGTAGDAVVPHRRGGSAVGACTGWPPPRHSPANARWPVPGRPQQHPAVSPPPPPRPRRSLAGNHHRLYRAVCHGRPVPRSMVKN